MEPVIFNVFLFMNDPRPLSLTCKSWYEWLRREQEDTIEGVLQKIDMLYPNSQYSLFEKIKILIENNDLYSVHILVHCGFVPVQWRWYILYIPSLNMVEVLRPVLGRSYTDATISLLNNKKYEGQCIQWLKYLTSDTRWSKLALAILREDDKSVERILQQDNSMQSILRKDYFAMMKYHQSDMNAISYIHFLVDKVGTESIKNVFKKLRIDILPFEPTNGIVPGKDEYPWPIDRNKLDDLIEYDRADLLAMGYGMTEKERFNGDDGMKVFISRIKKILDKPYAMCVDKDDKRRCYYIRRWIKHMEDMFRSEVHAV